MLFAILAVVGTVGIASADGALTPIASGQQPPRPVEPDPNVRLYAYIGTGATGVLAASTVYIYLKRSSIAVTNGLGTGPCDATCVQERDREAAARQDRLARYKTLTLVLGAGTVVTGAATAYLWSRATERTYTRSPIVSLQVDPRGGAQLAVAGRF